MFQSVLAVATVTVSAGTLLRMQIMCNVLI